MDGFGWFQKESNSFSIINSINLNNNLNNNNIRNHQFNQFETNQIYIELNNVNCINHQNMFQTNVNNSHCYANNNNYFGNRNNSFNNIFCNNCQRIYNE